VRNTEVEVDDLSGGRTDARPAFGFSGDEPEGRERSGEERGAFEPGGTSRR
jgi:hypothetical protein